MIWKKFYSVRTPSCRETYESAAMTSIMRKAEVPSQSGGQRPDISLIAVTGSHNGEYDEGQ